MREARNGQQAADGDAASDDEADKQDVFERHGQSWRVCGRGRAHSSSGEAVAQNSVNKPGTIDKMFNLLLPDDWIKDQLTYTNHKTWMSTTRCI